MIKPKIYGFCQAGCKWETVHKTDFDNSVTYIKQTAIDGVYYLDPIANYKIYSGVQSNEIIIFTFTIFSVCAELL